MKLNRWILIAALLSAQTGEILAEDQSADLKRLKEQLQELEQKVRIMERNRELDGEAAAAKDKETPRLTAGASGISFSSADTNFVFKVRGYIQGDARFYTDDQIKGNDTFLLRRVRPIFEGTVFKNYEYKIMLDLGANTSSSGNNTANNGLLQDAYVNVHYWDEAQLQLGKFKEPVGLERLQSGANMLFIERGFPTQLAPNRDVGIQFHGKALENTFNYAIGAFNGVADGGSNDIESSDDAKDVAARLFIHPFALTKAEPIENFGIGVAGTIGNHEGSLRNYATPGQQAFFKWRTGTGASASSPNVTAHGEEWRLVPQAYYYWGPFGIFGEYAISSIQAERSVGSKATDKFHNRFENTAWEVSASYFLTGERNSFGPVKPLRPFAFHGGGWGAVELTARVGQLSLDSEIFPNWATSASAHEANEWGVGVNWHLNSNFKVSVNYDRTQFKGGSNADGSVTAHDEQVILGRVQLSF